MEKSDETFSYQSDYKTNQSPDTCTWERKVLPQMPVEVMDVNDLVHNTLFLSVNFGSIGNSRKVDEDILTTDAGHSFIKVSKTLLDSPELKEITKSDANIRIWLKEVCHPFEKGVQLVPFGLVETVTDKLEEYKLERAKLVDAFVAVYPRLRDDAKANLGSLYNSKDYPDPQEVANFFSFSFRMTSVGAPGELKTISEKLFLAEKERRSEEFRMAAAEITQLMRQTLYDLVHNLEDKLTPEDGKRKVIRQNGLNKMQQFFDIFDLKDVTNDTQLQALVRQAKELMEGTTAEELRSNEQLATKVREGMGNISTALTGLITEEPGRMFREEDE